MKLWNQPMMAAVAAKKKSWQAYAADALKRRLKSGEITQEEYDHGIASLRFTSTSKDTIGTAKKIKPVKVLSERAIRRKARREFNAARDLLQVEVARLFREAPPGWEEKLEEVGVRIEQMREQWQAYLEERRRKPPGQGGALGFDKLVVFMSPRTIYADGRARAKMGKSVIFGPWWETPKTERLECEVWKAADLFYQTLGEDEKVLLRDLASRPHSSTYDEWMGHAVWHLLRGVCPALAPYSRMSGVLNAEHSEHAKKFLKYWSKEFAGTGFRSILLLVVGVWMSAVVALKYVALAGGDVLGGLLKSRRNVYPTLPWGPEIPSWWSTGPWRLFSNRHLYAAYVGLWTRSDDPMNPWGPFLITSLLRSSHWQNAKWGGERRLLEIVPSKSSYFLSYVDKYDARHEYDWACPLLSNQTNYTLAQNCYPLTRVGVRYVPGKEHPLTCQNYWSGVLPQGVYDTNHDWPDPWYPEWYALEWFDGLHAWVHWPWLQKSTRYTHAQPPDWWFQNTITWGPYTWHRHFPAHPYRGNPTLNPRKT